eukprot:SAG22_NODE_5612_length_985_cov_1.075621_1_plen_122_part_00
MPPPPLPITLVAGGGGAGGGGGDGGAGGGAGGGGGRWDEFGVDGLQRTWFDGILTPNSTLSTKYAVCIYWAVTTLTCVGYGDVVATTTLEVRCKALAFCCASTVFCLRQCLPSLSVCLSDV